MSSPNRSTELSSVTAAGPFRPERKGAAYDQSEPSWISVEEISFLSSSPPVHLPVHPPVTSSAYI